MVFRNPKSSDNSKSPESPKSPRSPKSPILRYLGGSAKERMARVVSAEWDEHPLPAGLTQTLDVAYEGADGTRLAADVYRRGDASSDPLPIAVFVHGGGLFTGSRKANRTYAEILATRGYVAYLLEYRQIDQTDGPHIIGDVCAGLAYLKDHAAEFGGDLSRILLIGESAGALLALYSCALCASPQLQEALGVEAPALAPLGLVCFSGMLYTTGFDPIGLTYRGDLYGDRLRDREFIRLMNPEDPRVESRLPPVLQATSDSDFLKSHTLRYARALALAGHAHRLISYPKDDRLVHAFPSLRPTLPESVEVADVLDAWFGAL